MNEEEIKAIEYFKDDISYLEEELKCPNFEGRYITIRSAELKKLRILLNLIEKQQSELEHQKEKRENQKNELAILNKKQKEFNKLQNTVNSYKGQFKRQQAEIEALKILNENYKNNISEITSLKNYAEAEIEKKDRIINEYEKECRQFKAFCKRVRRDKKHDVDLFNQGQEQKCNQFLNLISGEPHWSYEGKYFDDTDNQIRQYFENKAEEDKQC